MELLDEMSLSFNRTHLFQEHRVGSLPSEGNFSNFTLMVLVINLTNTKRCKKMIETLAGYSGIHLRKVLSESYPMNNNMTGFKWLSNIFASLCFGQKVLTRSDYLTH